MLAAVIMMGITAGYLIYSQRSGEEYYIQLTQEGMEKGKTLDPETIEYNYQETGVDKEGNEKNLTFSSFIERPLKKGAYLVLIYNENNGVVSYREIEKQEIPDAAMQKLESIHRDR